MGTRRGTARTRATLVGAVATTAAAILATVAPLSTAAASPTSTTTAIVAMGDSYISGEAGRWQGNSNNPFGSRNGTDRAYVATWYGGYYDKSRVYVGGSAADGCHRSDVSEIVSTTAPATQHVNLACSGAVTTNIFRSSNGGTSHDGEPPQADQLATVAAQSRVTTIVLSIGGNDLGFSDVILACVTDYETSPSWAPHLCKYDEQSAVSAKMPAAMAGVGKSLDEIRAVMRAAGYADSSYRIILQGYPSPIPRASENRYPQSGWSRTDTGGCPFWDADSTWARDTLVDEIDDNLRAVADSHGAQFLDLRDAFEGREVCSVHDRLVDSSHPPSATSSEWVRFLVTGVTQGDAQESLHPNAFGQKAIGRCVTLIAATSGGDYRCLNTPGAGYSSMVLQRD